MLKKFKSYLQLEQMLLDRESGLKGVEVAALYGVSSASISWWRTRYTGLAARWIARVMDLEHRLSCEQRHARHLQKLLTASKDVIRHIQPSSKKRSVMTIVIRAKYGLTCEAANRVLGLAFGARTSRRMPRDDAILITMMKAYFAENPGQGFDIAFKALLDEQPCTRAQAHKVYKECGLRLKERPQEKRPVPYRISKPMEIQRLPNQVWSMDFMIDTTPEGTRYWILNVIDDFNREAIVIKALPRNTSKAVIETLELVLRSGRRPECIRTDNGGEFKSAVYKTWERRNGISHRYIRPTKAYENAYVERFNGTFRREVLSRYEFHSLPEMQRMADDWRIRYNLSRPHYALGGLSPVQYAHSAKNIRGNPSPPPLLADFKSGGKRQAPVDQTFVC